MLEVAASKFSNASIHMKNTNLWAVFGAAIALLPSILVAQNNPPERKRLSVGPIVASKSVTEKVKSAGKENSLLQLLEALDTTLVNQINSSRKFDVVARKDRLKALLSEQDLGASGNVDPATAAEAMKLAGAQYLVLTTITDFSEGQEKLNFKSTGASASRDAVRANCSVEILDTTTGKLLASAIFRGRESIVSREGLPATEGEAIGKLVDRLSGEIVNRIVDELFPAKVAAKLGSQVTLNRGESGGASVGQVWLVFALGEEVVDPDTGEKLGQNEVEIGKVTISRVTPKMSYAEATEDNGIAVGNIVRPVKIESKEPADPKAKSAGSVADKVKNDL
jgi:curli biogenesis system outer membrane secretion channel CsgG